MDELASFWLPDKVTFPGVREHEPAIHTERSTNDPPLGEANVAPRSTVATVIGLRDFFVRTLPRHAWE